MPVVERYRVIRIATKYRLIPNELSRKVNHGVVSKIVGHILVQDHRTVEV